MVSADENSPRILVVDDDPYGLTFFRSSLKMSGYQVVTAAGVREAQELFEQMGMRAFDALLTDFRMPELTGLDLLDWVRERDEALATVIVTAQGEKELVKQALSHGAAGFLEKPITHQELKDALVRAVEQTARLRRFRETEQGLKDAGKIDSMFNTIEVRSLEPYLKVRYNPLREVGGDFVNAMALDEDHSLVMVGDVSGHDIKSAFVSAYFQGMVRGLVEAKASPFEGLGAFNRILQEEWDKVPGNWKDIPTSLALALAHIDMKRRQLKVIGCGFPPVLLCDADGFIRTTRVGHPPLGWKVDDALEPEQLDCSDTVQMLFYTDGAIDFANELEINPVALLYTLLKEDSSLMGVSMRPTDDLLILRFVFEPETSLHALFTPIVHENYPGSEVENIDHLQNVWRRSLQFALNEELGDRMFDLLICIREGVLNALIHGCDRSPDKVCTLQISYNEEEKLIRVRIDDPGRGHSFDLKKRLAELSRPSGEHLGLGIIQHLSDKIAMENHGASLIFDFEIHPGKK